MRRIYSLFVGLLLFSAAAARSLPGRSDSSGHLSGAPFVSPTKRSSLREFRSLPLSFESNQGQTSARVRFLSHMGAGMLFLTPSEAVFSLPARRENRQNSVFSPRQRGRQQGTTTARVALRMEMLRADPRATPVAQQPLTAQVSYFRGKDPAGWHPGVPTFGRVGFHQVYPGIDVTYYGHQNHLEYDFVVAPHADPRRIRLHFAGAQGVRINAAGDLIVRTQGRELTWRRPTVYQEARTGRHTVAGRFRLLRLSGRKTGVSFALGHYDATRPLVIDPVLIYSTYLGGNGDLNPDGTDSIDVATAVAVDRSGNAYLTGVADSLDFPTTAGAYQTVNKDQHGAFIAKLNATGTALLYSTFLGGNGIDMPWGIAVDSGGNAYVAGVTGSPDFPTTPGAFQQRGTGSYANGGFVAKLNPTGTALLYSTSLSNPGSNGDSEVRAIAVDASGSAYVTGNTSSPDFPTTPGAFQKAHLSSPTNAFVTRLDPTGSSLLYSTYLGGTGIGDRGGCIAIDSSGNAYVGGTAESTDFPTTPGVYQTVNHAYNLSIPTGFVTKLNATGTALLYSTYLGGSGQAPFGDGGDEVAAIAIDGSGNAFVTGSTFSKDFPVTPGAFQTTFATQSPGNLSVAYVAKLNASGSALLYSTFLDGPTGGYSAHSIAVDSVGNASVVGNTTAADFPTTIGAFQRTMASPVHNTTFLTRLNAAGSGLLYSTFLGGTARTDSWAAAFDSDHNAYIVGATNGNDLPITPGAFQTTNHAFGQGNFNYNAFVTKLPTTPIFPDFNSDGHTDLLIQNSSTNVIASWFMQGAHWTAGAYFSLTPPADFALVGVGDFSGNGATTLVLQNRTTHQIAFWYTSGANNATIPGGNFLNTTPPADWKVTGVGDFNGDGKSDLVLQNQTTNQVAIWFLNGALYQGGVLIPFTPPAGWTVAGTGDFNGDGFTDLVFQNQGTGQIALWYMNGPTYADGVVLSALPAAGWKVVGVGDYNGDGSADLLFQNQTSNQAAVWYLRNGLFTGGDTLSLAPPAGWKIVGPR